MADEYRPAGAFEGLTVANVLRGMGSRAAELGEAIPRQVAQNYLDLDRLLQGTPQGLAGSYVRSKIKKALGADTPPPDPNARPSFEPAPFAQHSSNPAVQAGAMLLDPLNFAGGATMAAAPLARRAAAKKMQRLAGEVVGEHVPRFDPGSPQQLIPGVEPLSPVEARDTAVANLLRARQDMTFEDLNRGLRFEYDPEWTGSALGAETREPGAWRMDFRDVDYEAGELRGKRQVNAIPHGGNRVMRYDLEDPPPTSARTIPRGSYVDATTAQAQVGAENFQQMMDRLGRLRAAESDAVQRGEEYALIRARELNTQIARRRALLNQPGISPEETLATQEEILNLLRQRPVEVDDERARMAIPSPASVGGGFTQWRDLLGRSAVAPEGASREIADQAALVHRLRGGPEPGVTRGPVTYGGEPGPAPSRGEADAMNREAVEAFYEHSPNNPALFEYGGPPPQNVRGIEGMARHFGNKAGKRIHIDYVGGESDEPYKIEKTHGRGEVMKDEHGDFKYQEHEPGDKPMYDPEGNVVTKEVEGHGPPEEDDPLGYGLTMDVPKPARGGEHVYDETGDPQFRLSRGGEPVRDFRGNVKEIENPDYGGGEEEALEMKISGAPGGPMKVYNYGSGSSTVYAGDLEEGSGGSLLYQTLYADASRSGDQIEAQGLSRQNALRILSNANANYARMGVNPRNVSNTQSGLATPARGFAEGPEIWRAEAEETKARMRSMGVDPNRVRFDGEGFTVDGEATDPERILRAMGWKSGEKQIGQKTMMRMAFFDWLRNASPEEGAAAAKGWGKLGPLLGLAVPVTTGAALSSALRQGNQTD